MTEKTEEIAEKATDVLLVGTDKIIERIEVTKEDVAEITEID